jgi:hypothetical protein
MAEAKKAAAMAKAAKPDTVVKDDPSGLIKPLGFDKTRLGFIDDVLGPAGRMTMAVINMLNSIVNLTENVKAFGARGKGSFSIEAEDDCTGTTKDLPRIKVLDEKGTLVATCDCDAGVVINDKDKWAEINSRAETAKLKFTPKKLLDHLAEWLIFLNKAQSEKPDMKVGINESQPFPQLFVEEGYLPGADWVTLPIKYNMGGYGCSTCCPSPCLYAFAAAYPAVAHAQCCSKTVKRRVGLDELLRRKKARSYKARNASKKNAKAQIEDLKTEKTALQEE